MQVANGSRPEPAMSNEQVEVEDLEHQRVADALLGRQPGRLGQLVLDRLGDAPSRSACTSSVVR
jgi:hypothetical protein